MILVYSIVHCMPYFALTALSSTFVILLFALFVTYIMSDFFGVVFNFCNPSPIALLFDVSGHLMSYTT